MNLLTLVRKPAYLAALLFLFISIGDGVMLPFFALWAQKDAGVPVAWIGMLFGCYAGGELLATPLLGGIADRLGRRPVLLASTLGVGGGFLLLSFCHGVVATAAVLLLIGAFESVLHPTVFTVIGDVVPQDETRHYFAVARVLSSIGRAIGPAIGALLVLRSLSTVFVGSAIALLSAATLVVCLLPETLGTGAGEEDDEEEEGFSALLPALRDRRLGGLLLCFMLLELSGSWVETVLPLSVHAAGTLSPSGVGLLFTFGSILTAVLQIPVTRLTARFNARCLVLASAALSIAALGVLLASPSLVALVVAVTCFSTADVVCGPLMPSAVNELAAPKTRATYMAAVSVANDVKDTIGPASGTLLFAIAASLPWVAGIPLVGLAAWGLAATLAQSASRPTV
ncbi:MAG TPA: MFS transporter [Luteibacter sp.]|uniref:MFS transporter n=1 Tax=Luteibacter sp. TaxID=1886636 RepID=UPI002D0ED6D4|nr:MFS transporter [Luteibacter sp.]HVI53741.1 MFS transporter [Luteibacter sp.]